MITRLQAIVAEAPDVAACEAALLGAYGGLPADDMAQIMAAATALMMLRGRADVAAGA